MNSSPETGAAGGIRQLLIIICSLVVIGSFVAVLLIGLRNSKDTRLQALIFGIGFSIVVCMALCNAYCCAVERKLQSLTSKEEPKQVEVV